MGTVVGRGKETMVGAAKKAAGRARHRHQLQLQLQLHLTIDVAVRQKRLMTRQPTAARTPSELTRKEPSCSRIPGTSFTNTCSSPSACRCGHSSPSCNR